MQIAHRAPGPSNLASSSDCRRTPSLPNTFVRCDSTVFSDSFSVSAICLFVNASAISFTTSAVAMPLGDASADVVVTMQVVEHLWDLRGFLRARAVGWVEDPSNTSPAALRAARDAESAVGRERLFQLAIALQGFGGQPRAELGFRRPTAPTGPPRSPAMSLVTGPR